MSDAGRARSLEQTVIACGHRERAAAAPRLVDSPRLEALRKAGTSHVYADTADADELLRVIGRGGPELLREVDGNTANQPLVGKVVDRYLAQGGLADCARRVREAAPELSRPDLLPYLYAIVCGWIGGDMTATLAAGRPWEVSLQLHMGLVRDAESARRIGRWLHAMVPTCFVKVPFAPQAPETFLVARDLEREGIPVNFTSTFSARQAVAAALLADATRTNIFMGRLNQGCEAELLGEHVDLEAQRALRSLREAGKTKTELIIASMREWQTFVRVAGCDVYTAPLEVLQGFLTQSEVPPQQIESQLETSYQDRLGISQGVLAKLGAERIARLYRVEPEFVEFLGEYGRSREYATLFEGDALRRRFEQAGFGDFFFDPSPSEWATLRRSKLPDLDGELTGRLALDTHYSLLADADFDKHQEEIDAKIERAIP